MPLFLPHRKWICRPHFLTREHVLTFYHGISLRRLMFDYTDTQGQKDSSDSLAEKASLWLLSSLRSKPKFLRILFLLFLKVIYASRFTLKPFPSLLFTCRGKEKRPMIRTTHNSCSSILHPEVGILLFGTLW